MDWLINTGQLSHFKQQDNKSVTQCSAVRLNGSCRCVLAQTAQHILCSQFSFSGSDSLCEDHTIQRSVREADECFVSLMLVAPIWCLQVRSCLYSVHFSVAFTIS